MQKKMNNDKNTIKNFPLSVSNEEIEKLLSEKIVLHSLQCVMALFVMTGSSDDLQIRRLICICRIF